MKPFADLPLKLLALLLGFGVWYALALKDGPTPEEWSQEVLLTIKHDPSFLLTDRSHETVVVHGKGPMPPHGALTYTVALLSPREGRQVLQLSPKAIQAPPGSQVLSVAPAAVELTFDRRGERTVPIEVPATFAEEGLKVDISPKKAKLVGPKRVLAGIHSVVLPPFTLMGTYPQTSVVTLVPPHPDVQILLPRETMVIVREVGP